MGYKVNLNTQKETEELMNKLNDLGISIVLPNEEENEEETENEGKKENG